MVSSKELNSVLNQSYQASTERNFVIRTGTVGMELIHDAMEKGNNRDYTDYLVINKDISAEQGERIKAMIDSPDRENYEVAKTILMNWRK